MLKLSAMYPYLQNACILFLQVDTRLHESERTAACLGRTSYLIVSKRQSQRRLRVSWSNPGTGLGSFVLLFLLVPSGTKACLLWNCLPMAFFKTFQAFLGRRRSVVRRDFDRTTRPQRRPFTPNFRKSDPKLFSCRVPYFFFFFFLLAQRNGTQLILGSAKPRHPTINSRAL